MNVPKLRFKGFDREWDKALIGDYLVESRILGSKGIDAKKISVKRWGKGVVEKHTIHDGSDNTQYYIRKKGQFIYGKFDFLLGALGIVPPELDGYESTLDSPAFDIKEGLNSQFLDFYTQRKEFYLHYGNIANGSRQARRVHAHDFFSMPLIMPNLREQEKIGEFFKILNDKIQLQQEKIDLLQEQKKGYMQKVFKQEIRFKDDGGGDYPKWELKDLGELCKISTGDKDTKDKKENGSYPFFVRSQKVEKIDTYSFDGEAILTAGDGVGVGKVFHYINGKFDYHQRVYMLSNFTNCIGKYVYNYFSMNFMREAQKYNAKTSVDSVRREMITKMQIPIPCLEEQAKIANFLFKLDNKIKVEQQKLEVLQEQKQGFMQQLFI